MEGSKQGPFLFVSPSSQWYKFTVDYCQMACDQWFNDCIGFIKTSSSCKFMYNASRCTGTGSGSLNYMRNSTKAVTSAPTPEPTASPTQSPTWYPTEAPTYYYGNYSLVWSGKYSCAEGSKQGPYLFVSPSSQKNKYTVDYCKRYCYEQFNDCTGFIKTPLRASLWTAGQGAQAKVMAACSSMSVLPKLLQKRPRTLLRATTGSIFGMVGQENMHGR